MKKKLKTLIIIMMFLAVTGCGKTDTEPVSVSVSEPETEHIDEPEDIFGKFRLSTVMIYAGEVHGSGVIFQADEENIKIATVSHVARDNDQVIVQFYEGKTGFGNVVYCDETSDITIINIEVKDFLDGFGESVTSAVTEENKLSTLNQYDKVYLVGSAINVGTNATTGEVGSTDYYVAEYDLHMIYLYADAMAGMSGSGCYSEDGVLIGILSAGSDNSEVLCININDYFKALANLK